MVTLFIVSIVAANVHIAIVDDRAVGEAAFLRVFGIMGMPIFGGAALFLASVSLRILKRKSRVALILDETALFYGGVKVPWPLMRETLVCKAQGRSYVGVRTVNDLALVKKMDEVYAKRIPYMFLIWLHYRQWRTQCSILIPAIKGLSVEELRNVIEEYRGTYGTASGSH